MQPKHFFKGYIRFQNSEYNESECYRFYGDKLHSMWRNRSCEVILWHWPLQLCELNLVYNHTQAKWCIKSKHTCRATNSNQLNFSIFNILHSFRQQDKGFGTFAGRLECDLVTVLNSLKLQICITSTNLVVWVSKHQ